MIKVIIIDGLVVRIPLSVVGKDCLIDQLVVKITLTVIAVVHTN